MATGPNHIGQSVSIRGDGSMCVPDDRRYVLIRTVALGAAVLTMAGGLYAGETATSRPNILLGTGAVPYETPRENILLIKDYVSQ